MPFSISISIQSPSTSLLLTNTNQSLSIPTLLIQQISCSCGNGIIDLFEECDPPDNVCCLADCTVNPVLQTQALVCRPTAGVCDVAEFCTLQGTCAPDQFVDVGTLCMVNDNTCGYNAYPRNHSLVSIILSYSSSTCTGTSASCPNFPTVGFPAGTLCRSSSGTCDVPEYCDGNSTSCPPDIPPIGSPCDDGSNCTSTSECTQTLTSVICAGIDDLCVGICGDGIKAQDEQW